MLCIAANLFADCADALVQLANGFGSSAKQLFGVVMMQVSVAMTFFKSAIAFVNSEMQQVMPETAFVKFVMALVDAETAFVSLAMR